jgi:hypothetical protein
MPMRGVSCAMLQQTQKTMIPPINCIRIKVPPIKKKSMDDKKNRTAHAPDVIRNARMMPKRKCSINKKRQRIDPSA